MERNNGLPDIDDHRRRSYRFPAMLFALIISVAFIHSALAQSAICDAAPGYACTNATFNAGSGLFQASLGQYTGTTWNNTYIAFLPEGTPTGNLSSIFFSGNYTMGYVSNMTSGQLTNPIQLYIGSPNSTVWGSLWAQYQIGNSSNYDYARMTSYLELSTSAAVNTGSSTPSTTTPNTTITTLNTTTVVNTTTANTTTALPPSGISGTTTQAVTHNKNTTSTNQTGQQMTSYYVVIGIVVVALLVVAALMMRKRGAKKGRGASLSRR